MGSLVVEAALEEIDDIAALEGTADNGEAMPLFTRGTICVGSYHSEQAVTRRSAFTYSCVWWV
jgi:hypothetical protein